MPTTEIIHAILSRATASGSRSTALQPMVWLTGFVSLGFVAALKMQSPQWSLILLGVLLGVCVSTFIISYAYYAAKNPDALRSEKFTLSKMAIEKNLIGDDKAGLVEIMEFEASDTRLALPAREADDK